MIMPSREDGRKTRAPIIAWRQCSPCFGLLYVPAPPILRQRVQHAQGTSSGRSMGCSVPSSSIFVNVSRMKFSRSQRGDNGNLT